MLRLEIREDDLASSQVASLLREHLEEMRRITPPASAHALDVEDLRAPDITFWTAWEGEELLGCGALRELGPDTGEIKSMRTATAHRGRGVGSEIVLHIIRQARLRGYTSLNLETGVMSEFAPARALYQRHGFEVCGPFGDYSEDPNTVFMTMRL